MRVLQIIYGLAVLFAVRPIFAQTLEANPQRMEQRIKKLAEFGASDTGSRRVAFSDADVEARNHFMALMRDAGLTVHVDFAGNIIGRRDGNNNSLPPIMFGSHIDTVPNGGAYDGTLGCIAALEVMEILESNGIVTDHPLEMVVFTDEEGGLTGSRALIGALGPEALNEKSHSGKTIKEGIEFIGGDPTRLDEVKRSEGEIKAFLELHIEQGAILENEKIDIGIVEGIVGIEWWNVTIEGSANHAGTTPMNLRQDAVIAGAKFALAVNEIVNSFDGKQVGTVGRFHAEPGAPNVIPGEVDLSLEIRDLSTGKIKKIFGEIRKRADAIAKETNTKISFDHIDVAAVPALTDPDIRALIEASAKELGVSYKYMPSGAGHDAQDMAKITPTGMIFVPSQGGISHSPKEFTSVEDMANGASVLLHTVLAIDKAQIGRR
jgi:N-carbamoyl-L-amino-acid hydrolase